MRFFRNPILLAVVFFVLTVLTLATYTSSYPFSFAGDFLQDPEAWQFTLWWLFPLLATLAVLFMDWDVKTRMKRHLVTGVIVFVATFLWIMQTDVHGWGAVIFPFLFIPYYGVCLLLVPWLSKVKDKHEQAFSLIVKGVYIVLVLFMALFNIVFFADAPSCGTAISFNDGLDDTNWYCLAHKAFDTQDTSWCEKGPESHVDGCYKRVAYLERVAQDSS